MIIRKEALTAVLAATSTDDATHRTDKIQVTPKGEIAATTGHVLFVATERSRFPDSEFPDKREDMPTYHGDPTEPITIDRDLVDRLIKGMPKKGPIPILQAVQLGINGDGGAYVAATDLLVPTVIRLKPQSEQAGGFPSWERIVPSASAPHVKVSLSVEVLQALIKAATAIAGRSSRVITPKVTLYIPTEPQHQGVDRAAVLADGGTEKRDKWGSTELFDNQGRVAAPKDYPNGEITSAMRLEIPGGDVQVYGAVAVCADLKRRG